MKKRRLFIVLVMTVAMAPAFAATYYWTNAAGGNDFSVLGNWNTKADGSGSIAADLADDTLVINKSGAANAVLSGTLANNPANVQVATTDNATGELIISGGTHNITNTLRAAISKTTTTGYVTISGGTINVLNSYTTFGDTGAAFVAMSGGILNTDRVTFGQTATSACTLDMTGGTMNIIISDATAAATSGALRMGLGNTQLNLSGSAQINTQKLSLLQGGSLNMNGGTVNILGITPNGIPAGIDYSLVDLNTFDFTADSLALGQVLGKIQFNAGQFLVAGDYSTLLDAAIASGNIYTSVAGKSVDAQYADGYTSLVLVPEPATLVLLTLGGVILRRQKARNYTQRV